MRKSLWIILAVLLVAIGAPVSHADTSTDYTLSFILTDGSPNAASGGTVIFDNTTGLFTTFLVNWDGVVFDFSGDSLPTSASWIACASSAGAACPSPASVPDAFYFCELSGCLGQSPAAGTYTDPGAVAAGSYALTVVPTPEPSSVALMLLGVGLVFVMRKRIGQRLPQTS
ncbi:MAG: PEP-CTERM sorting domain-containing protein [Candidatus Acidiferrales bacterium]